MVTQFLKALAEKTGWAFTVLMGGPDPQDGGEIEVVRYVTHPRAGWGLTSCA